MASINRSIAGAIMLLATNMQAQTTSILHDGLTRTYTVRLPGSYNGIQPLPLVIAMHGGFGSGLQLENQSRLSLKGEAEGFIVVYPDGTQGGALNFRTWNAGWCCGPSVTNNVDDVGFINALLDEVIAAYAVDTTRIYATGMSNGGFMAYRLACEMPQRIAAIAPVAASMGMAQCTPSRPIPVLAIHSYLDSSVPYQGGVGDGVSGHYNSPLDSVLNAWATHSDCVIRNDTMTNDALYTHVRWHECVCDHEMELYITQDGGHSWAGGGQGSAIGDPPSTAVSANDLIWAFFQRYSLACPLSTGLAQPVPSPPMLHADPARGTLQLTGPSAHVLTLHDLSGRRVLDPVRIRADLTVDVSYLPVGVYLWTLRTQNGRVHTGRILLTP